MWTDIIQNSAFSSFRLLADAIYLQFIFTDTVGLGGTESRHKPVKLPPMNHNKLKCVAVCRDTMAQNAPFIAYARLRIIIV